MSENSQAIAVRDESHNIMQGAGHVQELLQQVSLIQQVMKEAMRDGEHYGVVPGCGNKPTLLKPGAEKLSFVFRLAPEFDEQTIDLGNGHREVRVKCTLRKVGNPNIVFGQGVGSCSTLEAKYRYRTGPKESTGRPVPKSYWDVRASNPGKARELIGGKGFSTMKDDSGQWVICQQGEKAEHDNPADYYNTVLKMAKKRAHVDAVLTATAASDLFTQDVEDIHENGNGEKQQREEPRQTQHQESPRQSTATEQNHSEAESPDEWREVSLHFGKNKGKKLGELDENTVQWYCESWAPKPYPEGSNTIKANDLFLRKALDNAAIELGFATPRPAKSSITF